MLVLNGSDEDYHIHSYQYSDGLSGIDDIIRYAGIIGLKKIAITDHSDTGLEYSSIGKKVPRSIVLNRWQNVWNDVEVIFGIEGDLLDEDGNICDTIQDRKGDFLILSAHDGVYRGNPSNINKAYENAIKLHHKQIAFLGHPCISFWSDYIDMEKLIGLANAYEVPMEFNCSNYVNGKTDLKNLDMMLKKADRIYVNSDSHTLNELRDNKRIGMEFLKENNYI